MSGVGEASLVIGLISGLIAIIDETKKVYDAVNDKSGLPEAFREVADRLPIVYDTLKAYAKQNSDNGQSDSATAIVKACETKANKLKEIFDKVVPQGEDSRAERYLKAARGMGKGGRVEALMKGILEDLQMLVGNHLVTMSSVDQARARLTTAIEEVSAIEPSIADEAFGDSGNVFHQYGSGNMFNTFGGKSFNNLGNGNVFHGENMYFDHKYEHKHAYTIESMSQYNAFFGSYRDSLKQDSLELLRQECRDQLSLTDPRDDRAEIISRFGSHVTGTCHWITQHDAYQEWSMDPKSNLLWICGEPATGKTYLSIFLTKKLEQNVPQTDQLLAFYFCNRQDQRRNTALTLIRGLMHLLLDAQLELIDVMLDDFRRCKQQNSLFDMANKEALWRNFEQMLRITRITKIHFVLDALDECEESSLAWLLPKLTGLMTLEGCSTKFKIIIASRQNPIVLPESLYRFPRVLIDNNSNLQKDLQLFIASKVSDLVDMKSSVEEDPEKRAQTRIKWLSAMRALESLPNKTFLWVSFVIRDLEQAYLSEVEQKLQSCPHDLDEYYTQMLHEISQREKKQVAIVARVIRWVTVALRPLSVLELSIATETLPTKHLSREEVMNDRLRLCGYFIKVNDGIVGLIHQSAQDFLLSMDRDRVGDNLWRLFWIDKPKVHREIALACFGYIRDDSANEGPFFDGRIVHLNPNKDQEGLSHDKLKKFPFLQYAALHWPEHARHISYSEAIFDLSDPFWKYDSQVRETWLHSYWKTAMPDWELPDRSFDLMHVAAFFGFPRLLDTLLESKDVSLLDKRCTLDMEPLHWAVRNGHEDVTKMLLGLGFNPNRKGYGLPALIWAVRNGHEDLVRLLISSGVSWEERGYGMNALHWAAWDGREQMVILLLKYYTYTKKRTTSQDVEKASHAMNNDGGEFPWTTMKEANMIYRLVEAKEGILLAKMQFSRKILLAEKQFSEEIWLAKRFLWQCMTLVAYPLANLSILQLLAICYDFHIPETPSSIIEIWCCIIVAASSITEIWFWTNMAAVGLIVGVKRAGSRFAMFFMAVQGSCALLVASDAWHYQRIFRFTSLWVYVSSYLHLSFMSTESGGETSMPIKTFFLLALLLALLLVLSRGPPTLYPVLCRMAIDNLWVNVSKLLAGRSIQLWRPLFIAACFGGMIYTSPGLTFIVLLCYGCDRLIRNVDEIFRPLTKNTEPGRTAAELARARGFEKIASLLEDAEARYSFAH